MTPPPSVQPPFAAAILASSNVAKGALGPAKNVAAQTLLLTTEASLLPITGLPRTVTQTFRACLWSC